MISVRCTGDGEFAVIDGMHRVTSLQRLLLRKWLGIDYEKVAVPTLCTPFAKFWSSSNHRYGQSSTSRVHRHGLCSRSRKVPHITHWTTLQSRRNSQLCFANVHIYALGYIVIWAQADTDCLLYVGANETRDVTVINTSADRLFFQRSATAVYYD